MAVFKRAVVLLQEGAWYQKCYDPECRGYRSDMMPLPKEIVARLQSEHQAAVAHPEPAGAAVQGTCNDVALLQATTCHSGNTLKPCDGARTSVQPSSASVGIDKLVASVACGSGLGIFEGMQDDEECDRELLSVLEACENRLRAGAAQSCKS